MAVNNTNFHVERDSIVETQKSSVQTRVPQEVAELAPLSFSEQGSLAFDKTNRKLAYFDGLKWVYVGGSAIGFSAFKLGDQVVPNVSNATVTGWSIASPGYATIAGFDIATGIFTAPIAGEYTTTACVVWTPANIGTQRMTQIVVNGVPRFVQVQDPALVTNFGDTPPQPLIQFVTGSVHLEVGDTVLVNSFNNAALGTVSIIANSLVYLCKTSFTVHM